MNAEGENNASRRAVACVGENGGPIAHADLRTDIHPGLAILGKFRMTIE
jgi:hypothetical protein